MTNSREWGQRQGHFKAKAQHPATLTTNPQSLTGHVESYLTLKSLHVAEKALQTDRERLEWFVRYASRHTFDIQEVDEAIVSAYLAELKGKKRSPVTIRSYYISLRTWFKWLVRDGRIDHNPMDSITPPRIPKTFKEILSEDEIADLFAACDDFGPFQAARYKATLAVLFDTGVRLAELTNMEISDFEGRHTVQSVLKGKVSLGKFHVVGKGNKERVLRLDTETERLVKEYLARRQLQVDAILQWYSREEARAARPKLEKAAMSNRLWLGEELEPLQVGGMRAMIRRLEQHVNDIYAKRAREKGEAPPERFRCNPHKFRRTFAVYCLRNGADLVDIQSLMGHEDLTMTRHYAAIYNSGDACIKHEQFSPMKGLRR
jgi:site-specific recombinase XerD